MLAQAMLANSSLKTKYLSVKPQNSSSILSGETPDIIKLNRLAPEPPFLPKCVLYFSGNSNVKSRVGAL